MSGFTANTVLIRIQHCYQLKHFIDLIKFMWRMVKLKSYGLILPYVFIVSYGIAKWIREIVSNKGEV